MFWLGRNGSGRHSHWWGKQHNLDVFKSADWVIDPGPEGADGAGEIIAVGPAEAIAEQDGSFTGKFLKVVLASAP